MEEHPRTGAAPATCDAVIVAAGEGRRMGFDKLAALLAGTPVLRKTVAAFLAAESIRSIVVVCPAGRWHLLESLEWTKPVTRVDGGSTRRDSVAAGLATLDPAPDYVAVHDGARPLIAPEDIDRAVQAARQYRAAALARPATATMKRSDAEGFSAEAVDRENLWCMETPQVFELPLLREAYRHVITRNLPVTDEVSAVQAAGGRVRFVEPIHPNPKITTPADLALAAACVQAHS